MIRKSNKYGTESNTMLRVLTELMATVREYEGTNHNKASTLPPTHPLATAMVNHETTGAISETRIYNGTLN